MMLRPKAIEVKPLDDYKLYIVFNSGEEKIFDLKDKINHIFFAPLKDETVFKTVHTNGITVEWDGEIDICPDELYYNSVCTES
jgi:hypothetical protein